MKKYVKAVLVTLAIMLCCGGLLAVLSDLLFVSDDERNGRVINKIYADSAITLASTLEVDKVNMTDLEEFGVVKACYKLSNGDYLVLSTGKQGYANGNITTYVAIKQDLTVRKVVQNSYKGQTLMGKLTPLYDEYIGTGSATTKEAFDEILVSGATYSSNAASNSVYLAVQFVARLGGAL